jgi:hypothetical protein
LASPGLPPPDAGTNLPRIATPVWLNHGARAIRGHPATLLYSRIGRFTSNPATHEKQGKDRLPVLREKSGRWIWQFGNP